jgi:hypothetical protein
MRILSGGLFALGMVFAALSVRAAVDQPGANPVAESRICTTRWTTSSPTIVMTILAMSSTWCTERPASC